MLISAKEGGDDTAVEEEDEIIRDDAEGDDYGNVGGNGGELDICLTNTSAAATSDPFDTDGRVVVFNDPIKVSYMPP